MNRSHNRPTSAAAETINQLASDNTSGAAEILRKAGEVFTQLNAASSRHEPLTLERAQESILETCAALASAQPDMTPLLRLASAALLAARTAGDAPDSFKCAEQAALNFIANAAGAAHAASLRSAPLIHDGNTVMTHSRSSTVLSGFIEAKRAGRNFTVMVTESRPLLEGRAVASALASQDIPVILIADAAASLAMSGVDLVMFGADTITPGYLVNKIGTRMIALAASDRSLPVYAACDSSKFIREDYVPASVRRSGDAAELWPDAPRGVTVANSYFEPTPLASFTGIIAEDGVLSITEAARCAEEASIDIALVRALRMSLDEIK